MARAAFDSEQAALSIAPGRIYVFLRIADGRAWSDV